MKSILLGSLCLAVVSVTAQQAEPAKGSAAVIAQARQQFFEARQGRFEVIPDVVALVEGAVPADPDNARLLHTLAYSYSLQVIAAGQPGGNMLAAIPAGQKAFAAIDRAIRIAPTDSDILSLHGAMLGMAAMMQNRPEWLETSRAEIFRAVELHPSSVSARLIRANLGLFDQKDARDTPALIEDLSFLAAAGAGSRSGEVERLMLGDVFAEMGKLEEAREQYRAAARRPASAVKADVESRLVALERGTVPSADIARLRGRMGECVMCHAK